MDDRIKKMTTPNGFEDLFLKEVNQEETYKDVFDRLNEEYYDIMGDYRYSDYNSFSTCRRDRRNRK